MGNAGALAPLLLEPVHVDRAWGGLGLLRDFQPSLPRDRCIGESWDIACRPNADCRMVTGPMAGRPLSDLLAREGEALLGRPWRSFNDFPVLHKYLAPLHELPLQVHPADDYALRVEGQNGKSECWVVLDCEPGATVVLGLEGIRDRSQLCDLARAGTLMTHVRRLPVAVGDVVSIPAGIVHGLGAHILAYEVQQNSDVTYRLDDLGLGIDTPESRRAHVEKGLDVIDLAANLAPPPTFDNWRDGDGVLDLAPHFRLEGIRVRGEKTLPHPRTCRGLAVLAGHGSLRAPGGTYPLDRGQGWLLPARSGPLAIDGDLRLLLSVFPESAAPTAAAA